MQQGDIIARDDRLLDILRSVHSHFCDEKYLGFMVVTQSCDLVRRKKGNCKARHLSIATIRELDQVLPEQLKELSGFQQSRCLIQEKRVAAEDFLRRLIDQNEQSRGLFYLHPSADAGIAAASLAFLRITISLRRDHYDVVQKSRVGRLKPEFANKLGWLVGNLYSRIGTPDWDEMSNAGDGSNLVKQYLDDSAPREYWVPEAWINEAAKKKFDFQSLTEVPIKALEKFAPPSAKEVVIHELHKTAIEVRLDMIKDRFKSELVADEEFCQRLLASVMSKIDSTSELELIKKRLQADPAFWEAVSNNIWSIVQRAKTIDSQIDDPIRTAIEQSIDARPMIPPLQALIRQHFPTEGVPINARLDEPFPGRSALERVLYLIERAGNSEWVGSLKMIKGRLGNNTVLDSVVA